MVAAPPRSIRMLALSSLSCSAAFGSQDVGATLKQHNGTITESLAGS